MLTGEDVVGRLYVGTLNGSATPVVLLVSKDGSRLLHVAASVTPDCRTSATAPFDTVPTIEGHGFQLTLTSAITGNRIDLTGSFGANGNASGELRYGWQASLVRTLFGYNANRGGWNRQKALAVAAYLRTQPPSP